MFFFAFGNLPESLSVLCFIFFHKLIIKLWRKVPYRSVKGVFFLSLFLIFKNERERLLLNTDKEEENIIKKQWYVDECWKIFDNVMSFVYK